MENAATLSRPTDYLSGLPLRQPDPAKPLTPLQEEGRLAQLHLRRQSDQLMGVPRAPTPEELMVRAADALQACPPGHVCRHLGMLLEKECDRQRFLVAQEHATLKNAGRVAMRVAQESRPDVAAHIRALLDAPESPQPIEGAIQIIDRFIGGSDRVKLRDMFQAYVNANGDVRALCAEYAFMPHAAHDVKRRLEWRRDRLQRLAATRVKAVEYVKAKMAAGSAAIGGPDGLADAVALAERLRGVPKLAGDQRAQLVTATDRLAQTERDLQSIEGYEAPAELVADLQKTAETLRAQVVSLKDEIRRVERAAALATATAAFNGDLPAFSAVLAELAAMPGAFNPAARQAIVDADWLPSMGLDVLIDGCESDDSLQYTPRG